MSNSIWVISPKVLWRKYSVLFSLINLSFTLTSSGSSRTPLMNSPSKSMTSPKTLYAYRKYLQQEAPAKSAKFKLTETRLHHHVFPNCMKGLTLKQKQSKGQFSRLGHHNKAWSSTSELATTIRSSALPTCLVRLVFQRRWRTLAQGGREPSMDFRTWNRRPKQVHSYLRGRQLESHPKVTWLGWSNWWTDKWIGRPANWTASFKMGIIGASLLLLKIERKSQQKHWIKLLKL